MPSTNLQLGSGKLFIVSVPSTIEALSTYCVDNNQIGWIQGGATIEYKPTTYDVRDDMGAVIEHFITKEEASLKSGILTWDTAALKKLVSNETSTTTPATSTTGAIETVKIGAKGMTKMDKWLVVFEAVADSTGHIRRFGLVGTSDNGLTLAYQPEKETVVDAVFSACTMDANGTILIIEDTAPLAP